MICTLYFTCSGKLFKTSHFSTTVQLLSLNRCCGVITPISGRRASENNLEKRWTVNWWGFNSPKKLQLTTGINWWMGENALQLFSGVTLFLLTYTALLWAAWGIPAPVYCDSDSKTFRDSRRQLCGIAMTEMIYCTGLAWWHRTNRLSLKPFTRRRTDPVNIWNLFRSWEHHRRRESINPFISNFTVWCQHKSTAGRRFPVYRLLPTAGYDLQEKPLHFRAEGKYLNVSWRPGTQRRAPDLLKPSETFRMERWDPETTVLQMWAQGRRSSHLKRPFLRVFIYYLQRLSGLEQILNDINNSKVLGDSSRGTSIKIWNTKLLQAESPNTITEQFFWNCQYLY